ncbi:MAG: TetR/AcrR family transcriptional regulator [Myxococcota bacterium]
MFCSKKAYHHGDLRGALLEAAEEQLEEEGPAGLSLRKLGRALGVSPGAPYRHFEDKDALLTELATTGFKRLRSMMIDEMADATGAADRLRLLGVGYLKFASSHPGLFRLVFGWMPAADSPERTESGDAAFATFLEVLDQCAKEGLLRHDVMNAQLLSWSAIHGAAFLMIDNNLKLWPMTPDPVAIANRVHDTVWEGISSQTPKAPSLQDSTLPMRP